MIAAKQMLSLYEGGLQGARWNPEAHNRLASMVRGMGQPFDAEDVATKFGFADAFAGQLVFPFVHVLEAYPGCWPGPAQLRGDCVSHGNKNALLGSLVGDVVAGSPDPVSGKRETLPVVSPLGIKNGVLSTEVLYWFAGNGNRKRAGNYVDDGWYTAGAAEVAIKSAGAVVRGVLAQTGIDLSKYDPDLAGKFGGVQLPADVADAIDNNLAQAVAEGTTFEAIRDALGKLYFAAHDGSEGFESTRDANGVSRKRGTWQHCMSYIGADDRPVIHKLYGEPLLLNLNSWNIFNKGPRDIIESAALVPPAKRDLWIKLKIVNPETGNIMIPEGSMWVRWSDVRKRRAYIYSGMNGWEVRDLPDYLGGFR